MGEPLNICSWVDTGYIDHVGLLTANVSTYQLNQQYPTSSSLHVALIDKTNHQSAPQTRQNEIVLMLLWAFFGGRGVGNPYQQINMVNRRVFKNI